MFTIIPSGLMKCVYHSCGNSEVCVRLLSLPVGIMEFVYRPCLGLVKCVCRPAGLMTNEVCLPPLRATRGTSEVCLASLWGVTMKCVYRS